MTLRNDLATQNAVNWQTREDRALLAALDFTPVIPCESNIGGEHEHAAEWLIRMDCGDTGALCTPGKDRAAIVFLVDGAGICPKCEQVTTITEVERIGK